MEKGARAVEQFKSREQEDDLTMVIACARQLFSRPRAYDIGSAIGARCEL
jgi:hypothetical protein